MIATLALLLLQSGPPSAVADLFARLANDLSQNKASAFLSHFDRDMRGYAELEANVYALGDQAEVACSVAFTGDEGDERRRTVELDWMLQITGKQPAPRTERRRQTVRATIERQGRSWVVTAIEPIAFFAPPTRAR